jgi:outer membrane protein assembly factor BamB
MSLQILKRRIFEVGYHTGEELIISPKGNLQKWMIDLREVFLNREALEEFARYFWKLHEAHKPFQIGAMETAGIPLLTALLLYAPKERDQVNGFIVRKERKLTGLGRMVEGKVLDLPIIFVDDILNSGSSAEKARVVLEAMGRKLNYLFAVIDYRSPSGLKWRQLHGVEVSSLFTLNDFNIKLHSVDRVQKQSYKKIWQRNIPGGVPFYVVPKSTPLLVNGIIYRGSDSGFMHAFDAANGDILWKFEAKGSSSRKGIWSSPAYYDGQIYFGAYNGVFYSLDAKSGCETWSQSYAEWIGASPIIVPKHDLLYIGLEYQRPWAQGGICALRVKDGDKVWEHPTRKFQHGSPAYWERGDLIIWGTADHMMTAMEPQTGKLVWSFETSRSVKYAPTVDEERGIVAFASFDKWIYVLDAATGKKLGAWETGDICYTTPLILNGKVFCGSGDKKLYVIDLDRLEIVKTINTNARVYSSPRAIGNRVVFGTNGGKVLELDASSFAIVGALQLSDAITNAVISSPDDKVMYVSTYMNQLYAIERL